MFTCLVTRAVHLELAYALETDSFMNAFTRMVSRRGTPSYIISDNGTNFVSGERELRELVEQLDQDKIKKESLRFSHIEWHFNPPSSPHFGGVFEIMINCTLNCRKKWFHPTRNMKEGDIVLMVEPNARRGDWPLGRITETLPGDDGLVRIVRVKAKDKEYLRPVHRLCPLEYV